MQKYLDADEIQRLINEGWVWLNTNVLVWSTLVQALIVVAAYMAAPGRARRRAGLGSAAR